MKLTDLEPRWIHPNVFMFKCPHCQKALLTVKNIVMPFTEQHKLFYEALGEDWNLLVVGARDEFAWQFSWASPLTADEEYNRTLAFESMTVTPSVDASASGHWHGNITNGVALP